MTDKSELHERAIQAAIREFYSPTEKAFGTEHRMEKAISAYLAIARLGGHSAGAIRALKSQKQDNGHD